MRTIFHAAMFGGLIVACSVGLIGCGSSSASTNKMSNAGTTGEKMNGEKMGGNMMSNDKMSNDKMSDDKMSDDKMSGDKMNGDKMSGKMAKAQTP